MKRIGQKIIVVIITVVMWGIVTLMAGCQFDVDGGVYRTPRVSAKLMYKGEDETANHAASRDTGTFGTGNSFGMIESPTKNRQSSGWGLGSQSN